MRTGIALRRQCFHTRIAVTLTAADHLAETIVCPDFDHLVRQIKAALLVQFHSLPIQIGAADGMRVAVLDQIILFPDEGGNQCAPLFRGVVLGVVLPEGFIALPPEPDVPDGGCIFLPVNGLLPERAELFRVETELWFQLRVRLHKHFGSQRLGMVVGDDEAHIRCKIMVAVAVFARAGNHQIAAQPQQRLKDHHKGHLAAAFHLPVGNQSFIVDEPAAVPYPCGLAFICEILRHSHAIGLDKFLIVPEPEGLHTQKTATDFKQTVYKAEGIGGGQHQSVLMHLQAETLRRKVTILCKNDIAAGHSGLCEYSFLISLQGRDGILYGLWRLRSNDLTIPVENHTQKPLF